MFPVLIHPDLYRRLRESDRGARSRLRKTLARLRAGLWGGGTRVKRLRGVGRPVFEARTDGGGRLLFTLARSAASDAPDRLATHLLVWDVVEHDDVERAARRNRSPEAEFLELETVEQFEVDEPPPFPDAGFDEIPPEGPEDEPLLRFLLPPGDPRPEPAEALGGGVRWFRLDPAWLASDEELQRLLDTGAAELELKLTREQYEILRAPGPVLLAGSAGSGKTTLAAHRLAAAVLSPRPANARRIRALYLSYSPSLVDHARRLARDLVIARGGDPDENPPDFFTFADLYASLVPRDLREHAERPMTERHFQEWFRMAGRPLDAALLWEELRGILKGACLDPERPMLGEEEYFELGRKRAPLFVDERPEIWRIAQRYQEWLAEEGRSDPIDLCRRALAETRKDRGRRWDVIVCDEVQDLTELEVSFVLSLSARQDLSGLLLTGDVQQIVNPSSFRWAEVRRLAGRVSPEARGRNAPEVLRLQKNLRSVRPLVELANALLLFRREIFGRGDEGEPEEAGIEGPVPVEVPVDEEAALEAVRGFGPRCAVIASDEDEAERLRERLGTARVFTVREAKGLEFETVVLWKLLAPDQDLLDRLGRAGPDARGLEREARLHRLLRHLYVAVTRARRHLAIYEGSEPHPFWGREGFRGLLERDGVAGLAALFRTTASPAEWAEEGERFAARDAWRQAAECFRRAGMPEREGEALARAAEALEDWEAALRRWQALGAAAAQAPVLERLGRLEEAAALYRREGLEREARRCELRALEKRGAWADAAAGWETEDHPAEAARCWERAGEPRRALAATARHAERTGEPREAGEAWSRLGEHEAAERCFRAAGDSRRAAGALACRHEADGHWRRAAAAWRRTGDRRRSAFCRARGHEEAGRWANAARVWESLGESPRATTLYARAGRWAEVARLEPPGPEEGRRTLQRLRELVEAGDWQAALRLAEARRERLLPELSKGAAERPWFLHEGEDRLASEELRTLDDLETRALALAAEARAHTQADGGAPRHLRRAARLWERAGDPLRALALRRRWIEATAAQAWREEALDFVDRLEDALRALPPGAPTPAEGGPSHEV